MWSPSYHILLGQATCWQAIGCVSPLCYNTDVTILIDGHNLIGQMPDLRLDDPDDEEKLLLRLKSYRGRTGRRVVVFFDPGAAYSSPNRKSDGGISIRRAGTGQRADDLIVQHVLHHHNPRELTVVTSDRAIRDSVLGQGAKTVDSATFAADLAGSGSRRVWPRRDSGSQDRRLSVEEIQEWLEVFGHSD